jgi:hypothetical protein
MMRRIALSLTSLFLLAGILIPAAGAAELTPQQKFSFLKERGIFTGFSDGSAGLDQPMTREQFAQVLYKLMELPLPSGPASYSDVLRTRWSYVPIEAVTEAGLMVGVGGGKFTPESQVTVEQLAAILVRAGGWAQDGQYDVAGQVSPWARISVAIALQKDLIPRMSNYTVTAKRSLLVEAVYEIYVRMHQDVLKVKSVAVIDSQQLRVLLNQPVAEADKNRFRILDYRGGELAVWAALTEDNGMAVRLFTERHTGNQTYTLLADNAPFTYYMPPDDSVKPMVVSFAKQPNNKLELIFSEPVDKSSAENRSNYTLNNGLRITDARLSDSNAQLVILTTSSQREGTRYRLTVKNVKDLAGNAMYEWSTEFTADSTVPKASFSFNESTAQITVVFSEQVRAEQATDTSRYSIDKGLYVTRAELDKDGKTVYLTTSPQQDATIYTLTVSGISDLAGNVMQTQTFRFGGVANPAQPIRLVSVKALDQNTIELQFDRALSGQDMDKLAIAQLKENGTFVPMSGWSSFKQRAGNDGKSAVMQFRTKDSSNPSLFHPGRIYEVKVAGIPHLVTSGGADEASFAGTQTTNPAPYVQEVVPLSRTRVKVVFSEPVKNVSEAAFDLREKGAEAVKIRDDELNDTSAIVTEVVLVLEEEMKPGHIYVMTFRPGTVKDAAGWNDWQTTDGPKVFEKEFTGI